MRAIRSSIDKSVRTDGTFSRQDFTYDHEGDVYFLPSWQKAHLQEHAPNDGVTLLYRASQV